MAQPTTSTASTLICAYRRSIAIFSLVIVVLVVIAVEVPRVFRTVDDRYQAIAGQLAVRAAYIDRTIDLYWERAEAVSSRSVIRDQLTALAAGTTDLAAVQAFTMHRFADGVKIYSDLAAAVRYDLSGRVIARFGGVVDWAPDQPFVSVSETAEGRSTLHRVKVVSPIVSAGMQNPGWRRVTTLFSQGADPASAMRGWLGFDVLVFEFDLVALQVGQRSALPRDPAGLDLLSATQVAALPAQAQRFATQVGVHDVYLVADPPALSAIVPPAVVIGQGVLFVLAAIAAVSAISYLTMYRTSRSLVTSLSELVAERDLLIHETHHRVKNNLHVISAMISLEQQKISDPAAEQLLDDLTTRIQSVALIHDQLHLAAVGARIEIVAYLMTLLTEVRDSMTSADRMRVDVQGEPLELTSKTAVSVGLIVGELATNAVKYAFPAVDSAATGRLTVRVGCAHDTIELQVQNDGVPFPQTVEPGTTDSFGMSLIRALVEQLQGEMHFERLPHSTFTFRFRESVDV